MNVFRPFNLCLKEHRRQIAPHHVPTTKLVLFVVERIHKCTAFTITHNAIRVDFTNDNFCVGEGTKNYRNGFSVLHSHSMKNNLINLHSAPPQGLQLAHDTKIVL